METICHKGKQYVVFTVDTWGVSRKMIIEKTSYVHGGNLCLMAMEVGTDGKIDDDPWGPVTYNKEEILPKGYAAVKTYSENEGWAEDLARKARGKHVSGDIWDFTDMRITA